MANDFFTKTGNPINNSSGSSSLMRAEFAAIEAAFDKQPALTANGNKLIQVNAAANALEVTTTPTLGTPVSGDATNLTNTIAPQTHAATSKTTPVDADEIPLSDSAAAYGLKKLTWANLKATLAAWINGGTLPGAFTTLTASGGVDKLTTASGVIDVSAATAPTSGQVLMASSDTLAVWQNPPAAPTVVALTSGASWTVPDGIVKVKATIVAGGGGGGRSSSVSYRGGGGGSGGVVIKVFTVTSGASISCSIGAGGAASAATTTAGSVGGNTTFNAITATGGTGGTTSSGTVAAGGAATGGDINIQGGVGYVHGASSGVGNSLGGSTPIGLGTGGYGANGGTQSPGVGYGYGGYGGPSGGPAQDGGNGIIILEY